MSLIKTYTEYKYLNESFTLFIDDLINYNFEGYKEQDIILKLIAAKENFERLKIEADEDKSSTAELEKEVDESDEILKAENNITDEDLKDLQYLLMDGLFLSIDLLNFYKTKQFERFKMRGINYIRKDRVRNYFK